MHTTDDFFHLSLDEGERIFTAETLNLNSLQCQTLKLRISTSLHGGTCFHLYTGLRIRSCDVFLFSISIFVFYVMREDMA